jgi:hypothetical protein
MAKLHHRNFTPADIERIAKRDGGFTVSKNAPMSFITEMNIKLAKMITANIIKRPTSHLNELHYGYIAPARRATYQQKIKSKAPSQSSVMARLKNNAEISIPRDSGKRNIQQLQGVLSTLVANGQVKITKRENRRVHYASVPPKQVNKQEQSQLDAMVATQRTEAITQALRDTYQQYRPSLSETQMVRELNNKLHELIGQRVEPTLLSQMLDGKLPADAVINKAMNPKVTESMSSIVPKMVKTPISDQALTRKR